MRGWDGVLGWLGTASFGEAGRAENRQDIVPCLKWEAPAQQGGVIAIAAAFMSFGGSQAPSYLQNAIPGIGAP